jgi:tetratricopeptide (TPR) repeat protein
MRWAGLFEDAIKLLERTLRLDPYASSGVYWALGEAYMFNRQYDQALETCATGEARAESDFMRSGFSMCRAFVFVETGRMKEAKAYMAETIKLFPGASAKFLTRSNFFKNPADLERYLGVLRKAGLPEG